LRPTGGQVHEIFGCSHAARGVHWKNPSGTTPSHPHPAMIPSPSELPALPRRIILHWTGGGYAPNPVDLAAYHFVIDGEGVPHAGVPLPANLRMIPRGTPPSEYAAHCLGMNSFAVGVSYAAMAGAARNGPFGRFPLREAQFESGLEFVARCCAAWGISPGDPRQLLSHAEVERVFNVPQADKWDIAVLPWNGMRGAEEIGELIRAGVARRVEELRAPAVVAAPQLPQVEADLTPAGAQRAPAAISVPTAVAEPPAKLWRRVIRIFRGEPSGA
jgi:hypothetical protein